LIFIYTQEDSPSGNKITHLHITARAFASHKRTTDVFSFSCSSLNKNSSSKEPPKKIKKSVVIRRSLSSDGGDFYKLRENKSCERESLRSPSECQGRKTGWKNKERKTIKTTKRNR
jgi:hypothetical protein